MKKVEKTRLLHFHSQNLNEGGSKFWSGRAWLRGRDHHFEGRMEWYFGKAAHHLSAI